MWVRRRLMSPDAGQRYGDKWKGERQNGEDGASWKSRAPIQKEMASNRGTRARTEKGPGGR